MGLAVLVVQVATVWHHPLQVHPLPVQVAVVQAVRLVVLVELVVVELVELGLVMVLVEQWTRVVVVVVQVVRVVQVQRVVQVSWFFVTALLTHPRQVFLLVVEL